MSKTVFIGIKIAKAFALNGKGFFCKIDVFLYKLNAGSIKICYNYAAAIRIFAAINAVD
jgi:hypothetical protein